MNTDDSPPDTCPVNISLGNNNSRVSIITGSDLFPIRNPITAEEVRAAQQEWANGLLKISQAKIDGEDIIQPAKELLDNLYAFGEFPVLFNPTKSRDKIFRSTLKEALSYFVGYDAINQDFPDSGFAEDYGFAHNASMGWKEISFFNHQIVSLSDSAIAMGTYFFTATNGERTDVDFTFGYRRSRFDGRILIFLQHSSVQFRDVRKGKFTQTISVDPVHWVSQNPDEVNSED